MKRKEDFLHVRLSEAQKETIKKLAEEMTISMSSLVWLCVLKYKEEKNGNK